MRLKGLEHRSAWSVVKIASITLLLIYCLYFFYIFQEKMEDFVLGQLVSAFILILGFGLQIAGIYFL